MKCLQCGERDQEIFVPKTIQKVCIDQKLLPSEKIDLKVDYVYATKILSTEGLQLIGMEAVALEREAKKMYIDSVEYVPLNNSEYLVSIHVPMKDHLTTSKLFIFMILKLLNLP